jgi:chromosomal replication initiator protein
VARHFSISRFDMVSQRRTRDVVRPRQIAMYLAKSLTGKSFQEIGRLFGGRDHTTVMHAATKIENRLTFDEDDRRDVALIKASLR